MTLGARNCRPYKHEKQHASNQVRDVAMGHFQGMAVSWKKSCWPKPLKAGGIWGENCIEVHAD